MKTNRRITVRFLVATASVLFGSLGNTAPLEAHTAAAAARVPYYDHIVVVIDENRGYEQIIGSKDTPFINKLVESAALFTDSHGITHPSQTNYIAIFSGDPQGVKGDGRPHHLPFATPNLAAQLLTHHLTFTGYSEDLPKTGFNGDNHQLYARKHNPWTNWQADDADLAKNQLLPSVNCTFVDWPKDFTKLPNVAFVIPNLVSDMHNSTAQAGDKWLKDHLASYIEWAKTHNSLFILTFDEDNFTEKNHIPTLFVGAHIKPGKYDMRIDHYSVLRTIEDIHHLPHIGHAATAETITACFEKR